MLRVLNLLGILLIVAVIAAVSYVRIAPVRAKPVDFATLRLAKKPNQYLVCPLGLCQNATPHRQSPDFDLPAAKLLEHWQAVALAAPRTVAFAAASALAGQVSFVQRSRWLAYPDLITIAVLSHGEGKSSFALYSRSVYGRSDFGVNKARVEDWIERLQVRIASKAE